ncbi:putative immunity protein [Frankia gtarii]|uniref:putative immunity protein n=1 Tax=Frankia gtarii TaxID=2950102 RepID=UPI0021BF3E61|nr:hypothetical protein [Frankia gtarii]
MANRSTTAARHRPSGSAPAGGIISATPSTAARNLSREPTAVSIASQSTSTGTPSPHSSDSIGIWAADCAERVLPLFDQKAPGDTRPREAIEGIRSYACGQMGKGPLRSLAFAALAAARDVTDPAATAADQRRCGA